MLLDVTWSRHEHCSSLGLQIAKSRHEACIEWAVSLMIGHRNCTLPTVFVGIYALTYTHITPLKEKSYANTLLSVKSP